MRLFNADHFKELIKPREAPSISIYIPTHYEWHEKEQDKIRFKNHLQKIKSELENKNYDPSEIEEILADAFDLLEDEKFWRHTSNGLAMFISPGKTFYYRLPIEFNEYSEVSYRFHIKPLLPLVSEAGRYFILALDLAETKLCHGSKYSISEIALPKKTPTSLDEAMKLDDPEKSIQFHTGAGGTTGNRPAVFHGQGTGSDEKIEKKQILRFFQMLNKGVMEKLAGEDAPLVLIGIEYLIPIYKEANSYSHLFNKAVDVDPQNLSPAELHERTWKVIYPYFKQAEKEALNEYGNKSKGDLSSTNVEEIITASLNKRIDKLFVNKNKQIWGRFNKEDNSFVINSEAKPEGEDLQNLAIINTIENKGYVYILDDDTMPDSRPIAALFRYPLSQ